MKLKITKRVIFLILSVVFINFLLSPITISRVENKNIHTIENVPTKDVAIVFGAGIKTDGTPSDALNDRLKVATALYQAGKVQKILVSGDNSYLIYNEPEVMSLTLQNTFGIPKDVISEDYAGRRTYDTCVRAHEVWGISSAILVTQDFHLSRALYTCNSFGIDSVGVSASLQPYVFADYYELREYLATLKMIIDIYIWSPGYIGGEKEELN
ncbi:MAG: ElyC/SanA/YdcF family protein [Candidatus Gracilibacteria bacterium]